jgi:hypothetical protein
VFIIAGSLNVGLTTLLYWERSQHRIDSILSSKFVLPFICPLALPSHTQACLRQSSNVQLTAPLPHHTKLNKTLHTSLLDRICRVFEEIAHWFSLIEIGALRLYNASISTLKIDTSSIALGLSNLPFLLPARPSSAKSSKQC